MRLLVVLALVAAFFGLVSTLAIPDTIDLVPRARTRSPGRIGSKSPSPHRSPKPKSPTPGPSRGRSKSPSPGPSRRRSKSPTPGPSRKHSKSPTPKKVPIKWRGKTEQLFKQNKLRKDSPEHNQVKHWHEAVVRAHAAVHHPKATELFISKGVHSYGSKDSRLHINYEVKGPHGFVSNGGGHSNNRWHHVAVEHADVPKPLLDAVAARGKKL